MEVFVDADLGTLATALYARVDDMLKDRPELVPWRPRVGIAPRLSDAELITLAVLQVLLGFNEEARGLRTRTVRVARLARRVAEGLDPLPEAKCLARAHFGNYSAALRCRGRISERWTCSPEN